VCFSSIWIVGRNPSPRTAGGIGKLKDGVAAFIARADGILGIESEAGRLKRRRDAIAQRTALAVKTAAADRRCRRRHDLEIHILGHALDELVRAGECGAAAEHHGERGGIDGGQGADRAQDMDVLLDQADARQPEIRLDFQQLAKGVIAQRQVPCPGS